MSRIADFDPVDQDVVHIEPRGVLKSRRAHGHPNRIVQRFNGGIATGHECRLAVPPVLRYHVTVFETDHGKVVRIQVFQLREPVHPHADARGRLGCAVQPRKFHRNAHRVLSHPELGQWRSRSPPVPVVAKCVIGIPQRIVQGIDLRVCTPGETQRQREIALRGGIDPSVPQPGVAIECQPVDVLPAELVRKITVRGPAESSHKEHALALIQATIAPIPHIQRDFRAVQVELETVQILQLEVDPRIREPHGVETVDAILPDRELVGGPHRVVPVQRGLSQGACLPSAARPPASRLICIQEGLLVYRFELGLGRRPNRDPHRPDAGRLHESHTHPEPPGDAQHLASRIVLDRTE